MGSFPRHLLRFRSVGTGVDIVFWRPACFSRIGPPWYFIRQDFFQGVGFFAGIVAILIILAFTWRRYQFSNWLLLMMVALWMVPGVVSSVIIYWRCTDFFRYDEAVAYWPTYEAYSRSRIKFVGIPVGFVLALVAGVLAGRAARAPSANAV